MVWIKATYQNSLQETKKAPELKGPDANLSISA